MADMKDASTQIPACDRCRGQKLRCFRSRDSQATCNRCERAGAICIVDPSVRMGRPSRNQTNDQEQKKERRKHQRSFSNSPEGSIKRRPQSSEDGTGWNDEQHSGTFSTNPSASVQYDVTADLNVSAYQNDVFSFNSGVGLDWSALTADDDFAPMLETNHVATDSTTTTIEACDQDHEPTHGLVNDSTTKEKGALEPGFVQTSTLAHQTLVERLSTLNLKLYQQSQAPSLDHAASRNCSFRNDTDSEVPCLTASMLNNLQTFQDLLFELLQSQREEFSSCSPDLHNSNPVPQTPSTSYNHCLRFRQPSETVSEVLHPAPNSLGRKHHSLPSGNKENDIPTTKDNHQLNMPMSLLTISCYMNLVQVCRKVLVAIRCCLLFHDRETIFSDFQISGVSLKQDPNLQILLLIQVVMRFFDRIGRPLGCPHNEKSAGAQRKEDALDGNVILPHLLHFVLQEETNFLGVRVAGVEVINEEIRKLNSIINNGI